MLFVTAAGNDGNDSDTDPLPSLPAAFDLPNIVSVAAIDNRAGSRVLELRHDDRRYRRAGRGILRPCRPTSDYPQGWGWIDGTSMAAPHVSGTAALIASRRPVVPPTAGAQGSPAATGARLRRPVGDTVTGRMVDAFRSLDTVAPPRWRLTARVLCRGHAGPSTIATCRLAGRDRRSSGVAAYTLQVQAGAGSWVTAVGVDDRADARRELSRSPRRTGSATAPVTGQATGAR